MSGRNFNELLAGQCADRKYVCLGLDSRVGSLPAHLIKQYDGRPISHPQFAFNAAIVDATASLVGVYKPNLHFYLSQGPAGYQALVDTVRYIHRVAPYVPVILDYKAGDIGNTNEEIAQTAYDVVGADAATYHNYTGSEAMLPMLARGDKGAFILCKTSNPGSSELQNAYLANSYGIPVTSGKTLWRLVAENVRDLWNEHGNCGLVVGATYLQELGEVRQMIGDMPLLLPGAGVQGGDVRETVRAGITASGQLATINNSRGIIFASSGNDFAEAAYQATDKMHTAILAALAT